MYATVDSTARPATAGGGTIARPTVVPTALATAAVTRPPAPTPTRTAPAQAGQVGPVEGTWPLEHTPGAASQARRITRDCADAWHLDQDAQDAVLLIVSELVTNAVEHAQAPVHLHLHHSDCDNRVWIGVSDGGPAPRDGAWTRSCTQEEHGRGLNVVAALSEIHGTRTHQNGHTTHWARLNPTTA